MDKLYVLLLSTVILVVSCKTEVNEDSKPKLNGKWILVSVSGGITGDTEYVDTKTERHLIYFDDKNTLSFFYNDSLINTASFQI